MPAPIAATQAAAAAEGRVELGPLVGFLVSTFFPEPMRQNYAASYAGGGLLGAVVIDTMGEFIPPKQRRMPNGTIRCASFPGSASRAAALLRMAKLACSCVGCALGSRGERQAAPSGAPVPL